MNKLMEMLEAYKGSSLIYYLENDMYFTNSQVEQYSFETEGNAIIFHEGNETELTAFKINTDSIDEVSVRDGVINITFDNGTYLLLEMVY